jgi:hypothetical protein
MTIYDDDTGAVITNVFFDAGEPRALAVYRNASTGGNNESEHDVLFESTLALRDSITPDVVSIISVS